MVYKKSCNLWKGAPPALTALSVLDRVPRLGSFNKPCLCIQVPGPWWSLWEARSLGITNKELVPRKLSNKDNIILTVLTVYKRTNFYNVN